MDLSCQQSAMHMLYSFKVRSPRSIIITGHAGCGKSYLAYQYANMLGIPDVVVFQPVVQELRDMIDICMAISTPVVIIIENLDLGMAAASSTLLLFLEEANDNIHTIVTVRNMNRIPSTIVSRSMVVDVSAPTSQDLQNYAFELGESAYRRYYSCDLSKCVKTFKDIDQIIAMDSGVISYIEKLPQRIANIRTVSTMSWALMKTGDRKDLPVVLVFRYLLYKMPNLFLVINVCLKDLEHKRIATHAVVSRFCFEYLYARYVTTSSL